MDEPNIKSKGFIPVARKTEIKMPDLFEVSEGKQYQSSNERVPYKITTTNWVSSPTSPSVKAYEVGTGTDVTSTVYPINNPTVSGDVITLSLLKNLTKGAEYKIHITFNVSSTVYECYFMVKCSF